MDTHWPVEPCHPALPPALWEALRPAVTRAGRRVAVFDADGTLWSGDVGEAHLDWLDRHGVVAPPAPHGSLREAYDALCARDASAGYAWACEVMAGLDEARVVETARGCWQGHRERIFAPMRALVAALAAAGVEVWVVSASHRWIVAAGAAELGVAAERVVAVSVPVAQGRLGAPVEQPMPNGPGKVAAIAARVGARPVLGAGNSLHDAPMIDTAEVGLLVATPGSGYLTPALRERAERGGWFTLALEP